MKKPFALIKTISYLLTLLILCQSCNIYRSKSISLDEAVESESKVRVKTTSDRKYTFKNIEKNEAGIYGIAGKNSKAGKELANRILPESAIDRKVKIRLDENFIQEINPKNKSMSTLVPIIIIAAVIGIFALTYEVDIPIWDESGTF